MSPSIETTQTLYPPKQEETIGRSAPTSCLSLRPPPLPASVRPPLSLPQRDNPPPCLSATTPLPASVRPPPSLPQCDHPPPCLSATTPLSLRPPPSLPQPATTPLPASACDHPPPCLSVTTPLPASACVHTPSLPQQPPPPPPSLPTAYNHPQPSSLHAHTSNCFSSSINFSRSCLLTGASPSPPFSITHTASSGHKGQSSPATAGPGVCELKRSPFTLYSIVAMATSDAGTVGTVGSGGSQPSAQVASEIPFQVSCDA